MANFCPPPFLTEMLNSYVEIPKPKSRISIAIPRMQCSLTARFASAFKSSTDSIGTWNFS